ncbi:hypothetical protein PINS_up021352 [Pythium insidiosum]|nr:hypothetical protein PINS_up021352 [Pythium insidiosum]
MSKVIPKSLTPTSIPEELQDRDVVSSNLSGGFSPTQRKTKIGMGITSAHDLKINFFNRTKTHRNGDQPLTKQETSVSPSSRCASPPRNGAALRDGAQRQVPDTATLWCGVYGVLHPAAGHHAGEL